MPQRSAPSGLNLHVCPTCEAVTKRLDLNLPEDTAIVDIYRNLSGTAHRLTTEHDHVLWYGCLPCIYKADHAYNHSSANLPDADST
jgi:hypothetical protein